ncbi:MAG TPA: ROK family protein [Blastocatellia bacterium]|jgi:glucokinase
MSYVLGLDLGGTKVSAAVLDGENKMISRARAKTRAWRDDEKVFHTIVATARRAIERAGIETDKIEAAGIGSPGPLDPDEGVIIESANLGFRNFPLGFRLAEEFRCPVTVDNDVNAGMWGEFTMGAARGARDALGLFWGTGIGGGLIIDGKLYHGSSKNAGEIGHMIIQTDGPRCGCGRRGCLEAMASRSAMTRDIHKAIRRGKKTSIAKLIESNSENIPSNALRRAYQGGDELVVKIVDRAARYIGIAVGSLVNVLGPEVVVLGGGVIEAFGQALIDRIDKIARKTAFEFAIKDVRMIKAALGDDAGMIGAALLARQRLAAR